MLPGHNQSGQNLGHFGCTDYQANWKLLQPCISDFFCFDWLTDSHSLLVKKTLRPRFFFFTWHHNGQPYIMKQHNISFLAFDLTLFSVSFPVPVTRIQSVSGMLTNLPCNITPSSPTDRVNIVLWYKDGLGKPLYR